MKAEYITHSGDDLLVVNSARVSMDKHHKVFDEEDDTKLLNYLAKHKHWTPFAHPQITLRMQAPVPIRTQCFKHKQGFVENEESRRYISSTPELYVPAIFRERPEGSIKQGSTGVHKESDFWKGAYQQVCNNAIAVYDNMVAQGVCPEQARFVLPQGCEVNWYWTGSLAAFARFYKQRSDSHAQQEVQDLAYEVGKCIQPLFPKAWEALTK